MNHLKIFEDAKRIADLKDYFQPRIDWKYYNYLIDKGTEFEDKGYIVIVKICIKSDSYYDDFFNNVKGFNDNISRAALSDYKRFYKKNGLYYVVNMYLNEQDAYTETLSLNLSYEYVEKIKNNTSYCNISAKVIYTKPKNKIIMK